MSKIKPFLVETSKGYINLNLVQMIRTHRNRDVAELVFHSGDVVEISIKEWDLLYGAIVPYIVGPKQRVTETSPVRGTMAVRHVRHTMHALDTHDAEA
jgi:hypothetical protein